MRGDQNKCGGFSAGALQAGFCSSLRAGAAASLKPSLASTGLGAEQLAAGFPTQTTKFWGPQRSLHKVPKCLWVAPDPGEARLGSGCRGLGTPSPPSAFSAAPRRGSQNNAMQMKSPSTSRSCCQKGSWRLSALQHLRRSLQNNSHSAFCCFKKQTVSPGTALPPGKALCSENKRT